MNYKPLIYTIFLIVAFSLVEYFSRSCKREDLTSEKLRPAENERVQVMKNNSIDSIKFRQDTLKLRSEINALKRALAASTDKHKQATNKAQQSAKEYAENRTLDNCDQALKDCQYENEAKMYSLSIQERMLAEYDSLNKRQVAELGRKDTVITRLNAGWQKANADLQKQKRKRWSIGIQTGYGVSKQGVSPYVGAGIGYNLIRF